jgi:hypothetical protein
MSVHPTFRRPQAKEDFAGTAPFDQREQEPKRFEAQLFERWDYPSSAGQGREKSCNKSV